MMNAVVGTSYTAEDEDTAIHGTFNWTKAANYNKEHISIDKNHATAKAFADEFMRLKNKKL